MNLEIKVLFADPFSLRRKNKIRSPNLSNALHLFNPYQFKALRACESRRRKVEINLHLKTVNVMAKKNKELVREEQR